MITKRQLRRILRTEGYVDGEYPAKAEVTRWVQKYQRGYAMYHATDDPCFEYHRQWLAETLLLYQYMQHNKLWLGRP